MNFRPGDLAVLGTSGSVIIYLGWYDPMEYGPLSFRFSDHNLVVTVLRLCRHRGVVQWVDVLLPDGRIGHTPTYNMMPLVM